MTFFHAYQPLPDQPTQNKQKRGNKFVDYQANVIQYYNAGARVKSALSYSGYFFILFIDFINY